MKFSRIFQVAMVAVFWQSAGVQAQMVVDVGTADDDVIVLTVETPAGDYSAPSQAVTSWTVNGVNPVQVGRYTHVREEEPRHWGKNPEWVLTLRHHMYLRLAQPLVNGTTYTIETPGYGEQVLTFDDSKVRCEAIRVNQVGYFGGSQVRYANFAIYNGDLGTHALTTTPGFRVLDETGNTVTSGTLSYWGDDTNQEYTTGEYIYRIDLSGVPNGGPYVIAVDGYGCSYPFGVGPEYTNLAAFTLVRGFYHQRCGIALSEPYTIYTRGACHTTVEVTDAEPPGFITAHGEPRSISGGYHDAGDFDHGMGHNLIPAALLTYYEAYPEGFTDNQYNIPESGNGIPDFLDEALWGVKFWEELQEPDGGIRAGTESDSEPEFGVVNAATDQNVYRTYRRYGHTTAVGAGLFAQASRLLEPFDSARSAQLYDEAVSAWNYLQDHKDDPDMASAHDAQLMYASLQLYLKTGDEAYHTAFKQHATYCLTSGWPEQYIPQGWNQNYTRDGMIFTPYFFSYLITDKPVDQNIADAYTQLLSSKSDLVLNAVNTKPYPIGYNNGSYSWGSTTNQGRYADPLILMYRLTHDQKYLDAVSQLADYALGLNPLGKSYVTGLGSNPPHQFCHLDSYFTAREGKGVVPGIVVYGPIDNANLADYQQVVWSKVYPGWNSLPVQKRYTDAWSLIPSNEFTVDETMKLNTCMFAFLSSIEGGGTVSAPAAPGSPDAEPLSRKQINLSWNDLSNDENAFMIERRKGESGSWELIGTVPANSTRYEDMGLETATTYYYRLRAYNGAGYSAFSPEISATTKEITEVPESPGNLTATLLSSGKVRLAWQDHSEIEDGYAIERKKGVDDTYTVIDSTGPSVTLYRDDETLETATYYYRVYAFNGIGNSGFSNEVSLVYVGIDPVGSHGNFSLEAFPNPSKGSACLAYVLPEEAKVNLVIYDMTGRKLRTLVDEVQLPNHYVVEWNTDEDPRGNAPGNGIYLCTVTVTGHSGSYSAVRKLVVAR